MEALFWATPVLILITGILWILRPNGMQHLLLISALASAVAVSASLLGLWQAIIAGICALLSTATLLTLRKRVRHGRGIVHWMLGIACILLGLLTLIINISAPLSNLPRPNGPFFVGTSDFVVVDSTRNGIKGVDDSEPRELLIRAYYPADTVLSHKVKPYFSRLEANHVIEGENRLGEPGFLNSHLRYIATHTYENAPISTGQKFPIVVFSNGFSSHIGSTTILLSELASNGYVVFSLSHPGDMSAVVYPDGNSVMIASEVVDGFGERNINRARGAKEASPQEDNDFFEKLWRDTEQFDWVRHVPNFLHESHKIWERDTQVFLEKLRSGELPASAKQLLGNTDLGRIALAGTSFGGSVAVGACHIDLECQAAVNIDGSNLDSSLVNNTVRMPTLSLQHDFGLHPQMATMRSFGLRNPIDTCYEKNISAGTTGLVDRVELRGMLHQNFSDSTWFSRGALARKIAKMGDASPQQSVSMASNILVTYMDSHLKEAVEFSETFSELPLAILYTPNALQEWAFERQN